MRRILLWGRGAGRVKDNRDRTVELYLARAALQHCAGVPLRYVEQHCSTVRGYHCSTWSITAALCGGTTAVRGAALQHCAGVPLQYVEHHCSTVRGYHCGTWSITAALCGGSTAVRGASLQHCAGVRGSLQHCAGVALRYVEHHCSTVQGYHCGTWSITAALCGGTTAVRGAALQLYAGPTCTLH